MEATGRYSPQKRDGHVHEYEQGQSPEVDSSAAESDKDQFMRSNGSQALRGTKRKRPLIVS